MPTTYVIIWNKSAGTSDKATTLKTLLADRTDIKSYDLEPSLNLSEVLKNAEAEAVSCVIAAGGDGTVNAVAAAMLRQKSKLCLGIIPFGTGNDFARSLNIPQEPEAAFASIESGAYMLIDAVEIETKNARDFFINVATGGLSTQVSKTNKGWFKKMLGSFSYAMKALATAFGSDRFLLKATYDHAQLRIRAANIIVANGRFCGGGAEVAPRACLTDGLLDFVIVKDYSPLDLLRLSTKFAAGDHIDDERVFFCRTKSLTIESRPSFKLSTDGEVKHRTPITFRVIPAGLKVIAQTNQT